MSSKLIRTTIMLPEDLATTAKLFAMQKKKSLSKLIGESLQLNLGLNKVNKVQKSRTEVIGRFSIGIKKIYNKRSDLYTRSGL